MKNKRKKRHFGAIKADLSKQAQNNSYSPPTEYRDIEFTCVDCGTTEVWWAEQQRVYYEEWKQPIYHEPIRCRACRLKRTEDIAENNRKTVIGLARKRNAPNETVEKRVLNR